MSHIIRDLSKDQWKVVYTAFHADPKNKGLQIHHKFGKKTYLLYCCAHFLIGLTDKQHKDWALLAMLRLNARADKLRAEKQYDKNCGCLFPIFAECAGCLLLVPTDVKVDNEKDLS